MGFMAIIFFKETNNASEIAILFVLFAKKEEDVLKCLYEWF